MRQYQRNNRDDAENSQKDTVIHRAMEYNQWPVAKEVKEEPGDEDDYEHNHWDRVPQEAEKEDGKDDHRVINTKGGEVPL